MDATSEREPEINKLFRMASKHGASDLHLKAGEPPMMRLRGDIYRVDMRPLTQQDMDRLLMPLLYAEQAQRLGRGQRVAFCYAVDEGDVYRVVVANEGGQFRLSAQRSGA